MFVKILDKEWLSSIPIGSGQNKSAGRVTIETFHEALKNVKLGKNPRSNIEAWITETEFFKTFPVELVVPYGVDSFARILNEYNNGVSAFLDDYPEFYLWYKPV